MQKLRSAKDRRLTPIAAIRPETPPWRQRVDFEFWIFGAGGPDGRHLPSRLRSM